jgi:large subunit ribosomal protein L31e
MASITRTYTINLRSALRECPNYRKTRKAVLEVRRFLSKHMKTDQVRLGTHLNMYLWSQGIQNPPRRFTVSVLKDGDVAYADLEGHDPALIKASSKEEKEKVKKEEEQKSKKMKQEVNEVTDALGKKSVEDSANEPAETNASEPAPKTPAKEKPAKKKAAK